MTVLVDYSVPFVHLPADQCLVNDTTSSPISPKTWGLNASRTSTNKRLRRARLAAVVVAAVAGEEEGTLEEPMVYLSAFAHSKGDKKAI